MRKTTINRSTAETEISVEINLDGTGSYANETGIGFFDHMLDHYFDHHFFFARKLYYVNGTCFGVRSFCRKDLENER